MALIVHVIICSNDNHYHNPLTPPKENPSSPNSSSPPPKNYSSPRNSPHSPPPFSSTCHLSDEFIILKISVSSSWR